MSTKPGYLGKPWDEFLRRQVNRRLSRPLTLLLVRTPVTPNQITTGTLLLSLFASWLVSRGEYPLLAVGGLLFWFGSVLDCVDGEVARLKGLASSFGEIWDKVCDKVGNVAFIVASIVAVDRQGILPELPRLAVEGVAASVVVLVLGETIVSLYRRFAPPEIVASHRNFTLYLKGRSSPFFARLFRLFVPLMRRESLALLFLIFCLVDRIHWLVLAVLGGANLLLVLDLFFLGRLFWQKSRNHW